MENLDRLQEIDGSLLLTLQALLRETNVTRAAETLSLAQPTLSGRLARLRELFGDPLLVPSTTGRGMTPTELALQLAPEVDELVAGLRHLLVPRAAFDPQQSDRTFTIALPENPAVMVMPDLISVLQEAAPGIRIASVFPNLATIAEDIEQGRVDLLVTTEASVPLDWKVRTLYEGEFATAQRKGHPRGIQPLDLDSYCASDHILISADGGGFSGIVDQTLSELGRRRNVRVSVQSYALAPLVLRQSDCLCTLPRRLLARFGGDLDIFEPPFDIPRFKVFMYWHPRNQDDTGHAWLREQIVKAALTAGMD